MIRRVLRVLCAGAMLLVLGLPLWRPAERHAPAASIAVADALRGEAEGYARATEPRLLVFPDDHGPHPEYRTEWWYYTGNLATADGRRFGFQLTFFRVAQAPAAAPRASQWAASQVYMAHFAVTDAAAAIIPPRAWCAAPSTWPGPPRAPFACGPRTGRWRARETARCRCAFGRPRGTWPSTSFSTAASPWCCMASAGSIQGPRRGCRLLLLLVHPDARPGNRPRRRRTLRGDGQRVEDREWSTSALGAEQVGWDWFALQLSDGRDVMIYRLRRRDGSIDPFSAGTIVGADGLARPLYAAEVIVETIGWWTSPRGRTRYPARWRLRVPREALVLDVAPLVANQEFAEPVRYWEGAVTVQGQARGRPVEGVGYVELVGYADAAAPGGDTPARRSRSASRTATATAIRMGPSTMPSSPKAPMPPITLMSTSSPFSSTRPLMRMGRRTLSTVPTTKMPAKTRMPALA